MTPTLLLASLIASAGPPAVTADSPNLIVHFDVNPIRPTGWMLLGRGQATGLPAGANYVFVVTFERRTAAVPEWRAAVRKAITDRSQGTTDVYDTGHVDADRPFAAGEQYRVSVTGAYIPKGGRLRDLVLFGGKPSHLVPYEPDGKFGDP